MTDRNRREAHLVHDSYGRSKCSICRMGREGSVDIPRVEALLAAGARLKPVAQRFGISACALRRHWLEISDDRKQYLRFGARLSREALVVAVHEEKIGSLDHLKIIRTALHRGLQLALQSGDLHGIASIAHALNANVQAGAKLCGEWVEEPRQVTNIAIMESPHVATIISAVTRALAPFPEARRAVVDCLRQTNAATAALPPPETIDAVAE
jgi:hypothetical protein